MIGLLIGCAMLSFKRLSGSCLLWWIRIHRRVGFVYAWVSDYKYNLRSSWRCVSFFLPLFFWLCFPLSLFLTFPPCVSQTPSAVFLAHSVPLSFSLSSLQCLDVFYEQFVQGRQKREGRQIKPPTALHINCFGISSPPVVLTVICTTHQALFSEYK